MLVLVKGSGQSRTSNRGSSHVSLFAHRGLLQQPKYRQESPVRVQHRPEVRAVPGDVAECPQRLLLEGRVRRRQKRDQLRRGPQDFLRVAAPAAGDVRQTPARGVKK